MGALGLGNNEDSLEPSIIEGLKGKNIIKVMRIDVNNTD